MSRNKQLVLLHRPTGRVSIDHFEVREIPLRPPNDGELLIKTHYLSIDPTNRVWMSDRPQYMPPVEIGEVMRGFGLGEVIDSRHPQFARGDLVTGLLGWQTHCYSDAQGLRPLQKIPTDTGIPPRTFLGALGLTGGLTAYFGMISLGDPKAGETVVVSAAAGSVGSLAGQLAKLRGARVIGIAGGHEKCSYVVGELGFDACIDYQNQDVGTELERLCPQGISVYFDNVGGSILEAVLARLALRARVVLCGMISQYNDEQRWTGPRNFDAILYQRARVEGFIVSDFRPQFPKAYAELIPLWRSGQLTYREHLVHGLENAPAAVNMLFDGKNHGKLILQVATDGTSS